MNKHYQKHPPHSNRFYEFEEFEDKSGFLIRERNRTIDFFYDHERGWFDEYGNYYNKMGQLSQPSTQSLEFWEKVKREYDYLFFDDENNDDDEEEELSEDSDDDEDFLHAAEREENIANLFEKLQRYPPNTQVKVLFSGIRPKCTVEQVKTFFGGTGITDVQFEVKGKFKTGKGYCLIRDKEFAKQVLILNGNELEGQEVQFDIEENQTHNPQEAPQPQDQQQHLKLVTQSTQTMETPNEQQIQTPTFLTPISTPTTTPLSTPTFIKQIEPVQDLIKQQETIKQSEPIKQIEIVKKVIPQQKKPISTKIQTVGFDLMFENVPATVSLDQFEDWLMLKLERCWENLRDKLDDNKITKKIKVNFKLIDDAFYVLDYFDNPKSLMYKGKNKLHVKKLWN